jgi:hypothetical protein
MLACLLVFVATASARVVRLPAVVEACRDDLTSDQVLGCTRAFGDAKVVRSLPHAQLIRIPRRDKAPSAPGFYLFLETSGKWHIAGIHEGDAELIGFDAQKLGTHTAYHLELGVVDHTEVSLDSVTTTPAIYTRREQVYCGGSGFYCSNVVTACDVLVGGKAIASFRGTVAWKADALHIAGDRSHVGDMCDQPEEVPIYFPQ